MSQTNKLLEVAAVFGKMGCIAFGGPAVHIAMMEEEIVNKRKWMGRQHFLDLMGATNLIPGPNSTEMTMHCGHERAGWPGLFVAGISFVVPAVIITGILAWLYVLYGQLPEVAPFVSGIKPAVLAIIGGAILKLGKKALKGWELGVLGAMVLAASMLGVNEVMALLSAGVVGGVYFWLRSNKGKGTSLKSLAPLVLLQGSGAALAKLTTLKIFWIFFKVGAVLYGSGYVLFAYLDAELVTTGLLTRPELIDAIAVGQFTPGPVLSTSTFIGYQLGGLWGAIAATAGIFLPSFFFVLILNPLIPKMRKSALLRSFLDSVNIAAVAVMVAVLYEMGADTLTDWRNIVIAAAGVLMTFGPIKLNSMWVVGIGAAMGYALSWVG